MTETSVAAMADQIATEIEARLGVRGAGLETKLRRAGRLLPRRVRSEGRVLVENLTRASNPRLMKQVDLARCSAAHAACMAHLSRIDATDRRIGQAVGLASSVLFALLAVAGITLAVLRWRGFV